MSYINALEHKLASEAREDRGWVVSVQDTSVTTAAGVGVDPGSLDRIVKRIIIGQDGTAAVRVAWGYADSIGAFSSAVGENSYKSDGSVNGSLDAIIDAGGATIATRIMGQTYIKDSSLVIPINSFLDATDFFTVVLVFTVATDYTVTIIGYDA